MEQVTGFKSAATSCASCTVRCLDQTDEPSSMFMATFRLLYKLIECRRYLLLTTNTNKWGSLLPCVPGVLGSTHLTL